jgi:predicted lipoprotein with Yx(FWY)xxD motif
MTSQARTSREALFNLGKNQEGTRRSHRARLARVAATTATVALAFGSLVGAATSSSAASVSAHDPALLKAGNVSGFGAVLTNAHGFSLYGLSDEFGGKLACKGECLTFWPPVLVSKSATKVSLGAGVTGEIGFVARGATTKQVTFDGYPLYTFVKDSGPGQKHGEGVVAFGGTWGLLRASSLILPVKAAAATSTPSTTAASTSTTSTTAAATSTTSTTAASTTSTTAAPMSTTGTTAASGY